MMLFLSEVIMNPKSYMKNYRAISGSLETVCTADDTGDGRTVVADN